jgi:hypothetical protein
MEILTAYVRKNSSVNSRLNGINTAFEAIYMVEKIKIALV